MVVCLYLLWCFLKVMSRYFLYKMSPLIHLTHIKIQYLCAQQPLDLSEELGVLVEVVAGYSVRSRKASWEFRTLDPETG